MITLHGVDVNTKLFNWSVKHHATSTFVSSPGLASAISFQVLITTLAKLKRAYVCSTYLNLSWFTNAITVAISGWLPSFTTSICFKIIWSIVIFSVILTCFPWPTRASACFVTHIHLQDNLWKFLCGLDHENNTCHFTSTDTCYIIILVHVVQFFHVCVVLCGCLKNPHRNM